MFLEVRMGPATQAAGVPTIGYPPPDPRRKACLFGPTVRVRGLGAAARHGRADERYSTTAYERIADLTSSSAALPRGGGYRLRTQPVNATSNL